LTRIFFNFTNYKSFYFILRNLTMKTKVILSFLFLLLLVPASQISAQKVDFSGEWKLNREKSTLPDAQLFLSKITLQVKSDSLLTTRVYENSNGEEYPFDEKLSLDGKECKLLIYEMPRTSTAKLSDENGSLLIASTTTFNGMNGQEDMVANETWKVESNGQMLTLTFTNKMSGAETSGTYYYDKVK
jgi:hypothetical protein